MNHSGARVTRRHLLAAAALVPCPVAAYAQHFSTPPRPAMSPSIRSATPKDLPAIVALLNRGAHERTAHDPLLWRIAPDGQARIERAVGAALDGRQGAQRELWLVVEQARRMVAVARAMLVPVPPIYDDKAGSPGLLLDDCFVSGDAPSGTAEALLAASEAGLKMAGAARLIASCPSAGSLRPVYERHGYQPVTLYMVKHQLSSTAPTPGVRPATVEDVPGIVLRSAEHRRMLATISPDFWHIHPEADRRFDSWMRRSLSLKDRDMLVTGAVGEVRGYVIAQPSSSLLLPAGQEVAAIGVIDDFYDEDLATAASLSNAGSNGARLLAAAESAFARRGVDSALVVCPAAWPSKIALLEQCGYRTAKLWMLKR
jgi:hypothetical protein